MLIFFASVFLKKNLSRRKFGASVILLVISNITALALLDSHFWSKAFAVIIYNILNELRRIGIGMKQNFRSRRI